jgi:hypothetical protein
MDFGYVLQESPSFGQSSAGSESEYGDAASCERGAARSREGVTSLAEERFSSEEHGIGRQTAEWKSKNEEEEEEGEEEEEEEEEGQAAEEKETKETRR